MMPVTKRLQNGEVSCRVTEYVIQYFSRKGLPTAHLTKGLDYTLEELQATFASMPWDDYLIFFRNSQEGLTPSQIVELCSSYNSSPYMRPFLSAAGLFIKPARYFELAAKPRSGAFAQLYRCLDPSFKQVSSREVEFGLHVRDGYTLPSDLFWQSHVIGLGAVTSHFGLSPSLVTWKPAERGALYSIRLPVFRPLRSALLWLMGWLRKDIVDDVHIALAYGHERSLQLEQEIEERKRVEESLRASEERWKFALEGAGTGVLDWDITSDRIFFSDRWREITGYAKGEFSETGSGLKAIVHPDDLSTAVSDLEETLAGRKVLHRIEHRLKRADGSWVWIETRSTVTSRGVDGAPLRMIGTHTDISDRKMAEESLRESEARYRRAERGTNDGLWDWNIVTGENYFSPRLLELLHYSPGELPYRSDTFYELLHPEDRARISDAVDRHLVNDDLYAVEMRLRCKEGDYLWVQARGVAERNAEGVPLRMAGSVTDISDRRRTEEALRKSEDRLQQAIRVAQIGIFDHDHLRDTIYWSPELRMIHGWSEGDPATLDDYLELVHPDDRAEIANAIRKAHDPTGNGLFDVESRIKRRSDGEIRWIATRSQTHFAGEGQARHPVRTMGAVLDFTDRKLAAEEAIRSRDIAQRALAELKLESARAQQFYQLVEQAGQGIGIAKLDGTLSYLNPAFRKLLDIPDDADVTQFTFSNVIPENNREISAERVLSLARETGAWSGEFRLKTLSGKNLEIFNNVFRLMNTDGEAIGFSKIATDVTDRKRVENSLRESEGLLAEAQKIARIGSWSWDPVSNMVWWSDALYEIFGTDRLSTQPSFDAFLELLHPLDRPMAIQRVDGMLAGKNEFANDFRIVRPDGVSVWIHSRARATRDAKGNFIRVDGTDQDITDRKKAELALRASELRYRTLIETSSDAIFQMDLSGRIISANSTAAKMHGYSMEELLSLRMQDLDALDALANASEFPERLNRLKKGESLTFEAWHRRKDGSTFPLEVIASAEELEGEWFVLAFDRDITERKRAQEELRKSEERLRIALSAATAVAFIWDAQTDSVIRYFSTEPALPANMLAPEPVAAVRAMIHPDDIAVFDAGIEACQVSSGDYRNLYRIIRKDGSIRWLEEWGIMNRDASGKPLQLTGISIDVTDRKESELALLEEKQLLQAVFESLPGVAYAFDQSGRYLRWNHNYEKLLGWNDEDMRGLTAIETIAPRDRERVSAVIQQAFIKGQNTAELYALARDGREIPLYCSAVRVSLRGQPCLVGFGIDISDRIAAESELKARESQLRTFIENAPAGVAMFDRDMKYLSYSRRWLSDFDLNEQNIVGRSHYEVFPEVTERWKAIHNHCLAGNSQQSDEDRFTRSNGTTEYSRWEIQPWYEATGDVGGIILFAESVTDRVIAEERLRNSLREKEAMLKEIHHRVKNNLQVISSLLSLQASRHTHSAVNEVLNESQNRIRAMALVHETLYRSDDLAKVDLAQYLKELCGYLFRAYGVDSSRIQLEYDVQTVALSLDKSITCGLLVNEIVSNSLKHAFPTAMIGTITIVLQDVPDGRVDLRIVDNGIGLPPDFDIAQSSSLGLQLVNILTEQLSGQLTIRRDRGTSFEISFLQ